MYLNYYSRMRNTISGDLNEMVAREKNKIVTKVITQSNWTWHEQIVFQAKVRALTRAVQGWIATHPNLNDMRNYYQEFRIPKHSGGYRTLHAPEESLKVLQRRILDFLIMDCKLLCHNAVHSYVRHRNCKTAMEVHQSSGARWFLKLDIKDFFDNCEYDAVIIALQQIHPLSLIPEPDLRTIFCLCFLSGRLPQGAPTSPMLSNLYMQNFDYQLTKELRHFTYTRYADDLLISSTTEFNYTETAAKVEALLPSSLMIKREKTRYGSCSGSNWNLGLMYNKDREITVGYRNKHTVKNRIHNLFSEPYNTYADEEKWGWVQRLCELKGVLGYYTFIEPEYFNNLINKYREKGYTL